MKLVLRSGERVAEAVVEPLAGPPDGGFRVELDGRIYELDVAELGDGLASLRLGRGPAAGRQVEVAVEPLGGRGGGDRYRVTAGGGEPTEVEVLDPLTHRARQGGGGRGAGRREQVTAYMPGRVVAVLAEEGAEVVAGQGVVVLEAMKMENEIAAEHAGTLRRVLVEPGQAVEAGEPLFEIA